MAFKTMPLLFAIFLLITSIKANTNVESPLVNSSKARKPSPPLKATTAAPEVPKSPTTLYPPKKMTPPPPPPPTKAPTPPPPAVKTPPPPPPPPRPKNKQECTSRCMVRCKDHSRQNVCIRACTTCCERCKCVPPGQSGNREKCGKCYTDMTTHGGMLKCP